MVCQYFLMIWFAHDATDSILFWPFFGIVFESDFKICVIYIFVVVVGLQNVGL